MIARLLARWVSALFLLVVLPAAAGPVPAERVYLHGLIYTLDERHPQAEALAVAQGRIAFVGTDADAQHYIGAGTEVIDLGGRRVMPGLIDGHLHPLMGGLHLIKCSLKYEPLSVAQFQSRIQACLDAQPTAHANQWLEVVDWFRYAMLPKGVTVSRHTLDALHTTRPIVVSDSFGHTSLVNSTGLALAGITSSSKDIVGGRIDRDERGAPNGLLEDAAQERVDSLLPKPTPSDEQAAAAAAQKALNEQGVTTILDAWADPADLRAFSALARDGKLSVRAHFAPVIRPAAVPTPAAADAEVARIVGIARQYDQGPLHPQPSITVRNAKLFLDGVITAPADTGALLAPYWSNQGTADAPRYAPDPKQHPAVYFPAPILARLLVDLGRAGIDPHMHTDGDAAVRAALDAVAVMRQQMPDADIRPALAHCELVDPADYRRFAQLRAIAVLSFQWEKPAPDTIEGALNSLGPERHARMEPAGFLAEQHAPIAFGSDWPVDKLDEWFALQVGVTRTAGPNADSSHRGRLGTDPGLSRAAVLHAITLGAARELHQDQVTGSLQIGKFADFIVLDRDVLAIPAEQIADTRVLLTVLGGRTVFDRGILPRPATR